MDKTPGKTIAIYGAGGHGRVVADIARAIGYENILFLDDGKEGCMSFAAYAETASRHTPVALGVGDNSARRQCSERVETAGFPLATLIHPSAVMSEYEVTIGGGTVVMPLAVVNAGSHIGKGVIVNSGAIIEHDCRIGDFAHLSPGCILAGGVTVEEDCHIGMGASILPGLSVKAGTVVGAGSVVTRSLENGVVAYGTPARSQRRLDA